MLMAKARKNDLGVQQAEMKRQIEHLVRVIAPQAHNVLVTPLGKAKAVFVSFSAHGSHPVWRELHKATSYKMLLKKVQQEADKLAARKAKEAD